MKKSYYHIIMVFCLSLIGTSMYGQQIGPISQGDDPRIEYKVEENANGCYEVFFRSTVAFNGQRLQSAQVTLVVEKGTITRTNVPNANVTGNTGISFAATVNGDKYEIQDPGTALATTNDYLVFGLNPFTATVAANTDYLLFTFCVDGGCPGTIRMLDGVSQFSPHRQGSTCSACSKYTGPLDPVQQFLDPYNSMSIDNNVGSGPGNVPNTIEGYQGNYGAPVACDLGDPDLTIGVTPTTATGSINSPQVYDVTVTNSGVGPTVGNVSSTFDIPTGVTVNSAGGNGWTCTPTAPVNGPQTLVCVNTTPNLVGGDASSYTVNVTPTVSGSYNFQVNAAGGGDVNSANNTTNVTLSVDPDCNISAGTISIN